MMTAQATPPSADFTSLLASTLSPDQKSRQAAEQHLQQASAMPGFMGALAHILSSATQPVPIRQSAAVYLKNFIDKHWIPDDDESDPVQIGSSEKDAIKSQMLALMIHTASLPQVHKQLRECLHSLVRWEFPEKWLPLVDQMSQSLSSESSVISGLTALFEVFSWKGYDNDALTEELHARFAPTLLDLAQKGLSAGTEQGHAVARWVCKCFRAAVQFRFSYPLLGHYGVWHELFCAIIALPTNGVKVQDMDDLEEMSLFRLKKAALQAQNRVFGRYGIAKKTSTQEQVQAFSQTYLPSLAPAVLQLNLKLIEDYLNSKAIVTDSMFMLLCDLLEDAVGCKPLWKSGLSSHALPIIQHFLFPRVCFSADEQEEWESDPVEFVRSRLDPYEEYESPSTVSLNLIVSMVKKHKKSLLHGLFAFLNGLLPSNNPQSSVQRQEGALRILGSLIKTIDKALKQTGHLVDSLLLPILSSPSNPLLQMRAAWALEQFSTDVHLPRDVSVKAFLVCFDVLKTTQDLPVKVQCAITIGSLLDEEAVQMAAAPCVLPMMELILDLTNSIDIEALSALIEKLVNMYATDLAPYAAQLGQQLVNTFMRMLPASVPAEQDFEFDGAERMMSAIGLLRALSTLASAMSSNDEIIAQLEVLFVPMLVSVFEKRIMDVYDESFTLACEITFYRKRIAHEGYWRLYELIFALAERPCGLDHISDICTLLDNYVTYASAHILANAKWASQLFSLIQRILSGSESSYLDEYNYVCTVVTSLFLSQPTGLPAASIIPLLDHRLSIEVHEQSDNSIGKLLQVYLSILFHYHQPAILQTLKPQFWEQLVKQSRHFTRVFDKKLVICGLAPILDQLPTVHVLQVYLSAVETLPKAVERRQKLAEQDQDGDDDSVSDQGFYSSSEGELDMDSEEEKPAKGGNGESISEWSDEGDDESFGGDDDEGDEIWEEEFNVETPLDHLDVAQVVQATLPKLARHAPLFDQLPYDQRLFLNTLFPH
jgi:hypothetical protein